MNKGLREYMFQKAADKMVQQQVSNNLKQEAEDSQKTLMEEDMHRRNKTPEISEQKHIIPQKNNSPEESKNESTKKPIPIHKKIKKSWQSGYRILSVSDPIILDPNNNKTKYKYCIRIDYLDDKNKKKSRVMKIGKKKTQYRVDGATKDQAIIQNAQFIKCQNPFDKNYWVIHLLNQGPDIYDNRANYMKIIQQK